MAEGGGTPGATSQGGQGSQGSISGGHPKDSESANNVEQESERSSAAGSPGSPGPPRGSPGPPPAPAPAPPQNLRSDQDINGSMAGMFRGLQGLAGLPQLSQQMSQLAASLQGLAAQPPTTPAQTLSSPLNLSVAANGGLSSSNGATGAAAATGAGLLQPTLPSPMPQLILASGHLVQGIQGAQLLIPTSQGIATQTILTIPVNHVNSSDQMVNLALNNGQVVSTSLANLQAMTQPHQLLNNPSTNPTLRNNLLSQSANAALTNALLNPSALPGLLANGAVGAQQILQALQQQQQSQPHLHTAHNPTQLLQTVPQSNLQSNQHSPSSSSNWSEQSHHQQRHYKERDSLGYHQMSQNNHGESSFMGELSRDRDKNSSRERERDRDRDGIGSMTNGINGSCSNQSVSAAAAALSSISRLAASNGELTITPARGGNSPGRTPPCKLSPASTDASDLLADSPDQPTINQTSSNVVDGINLDDIKEFAKAFKLRRLSLGLTQTQVGQALSVTEGPAYSQSAICSALASQMFAAQLSSQQQNIFEKLDITPKSAQKIKPVLERWMKEAEERYASGQGHLTDFIGMEPSKKRKRRTSFTPQALELLNAHFERNTHPSGTEITGLAHQLGYEREVIRIWFCNKRQALKNTGSRGSTSYSQMWTI